jgi:hypothetical protein
MVLILWAANMLSLSAPIVFLVVAYIVIDIVTTVINR